MPSSSFLKSLRRVSPETHAVFGIPHLGVPLIFAVSTDEKHLEAVRKDTASHFGSSLQSVVIDSPNAPWTFRAVTPEQAFFGRVSDGSDRRNLDVVGLTATWRLCLSKTALLPPPNSVVIAPLNRQKEPDFSSLGVVYAFTLVRHGPDSSLADQFALARPHAVDPHKDVARSRSWKHSR